MECYAKAIVTVGVMSYLSEVLISGAQYLSTNMTAKKISRTTRPTFLCATFYSAKINIVSVLISKSLMQTGTVVVHLRSFTGEKILSQTRATPYVRYRGMSPK